MHFSYTPFRLQLFSSPQFLLFIKRKGNPLRPSFLTASFTVTSVSFSFSHFLPWKGGSASITHISDVRDARRSQILTVQSEERMSRQTDASEHLHEE